MPAISEYQRLMHAEKHSSDEGRKAALLIDSMPGLEANFALVLDRLYARLSAETWADFSRVLDHLQEASELLHEAPICEDDK